MKRAVFLCMALVIGLGFAFEKAKAITLPHPETTINGNPVAIPFGDFYSYSLPLLDHFFGTSEFTIPSSPGQIADDIVLATGAAGNPVTTNDPGMDDAYETPSGASSLPYFDTDDAATYPDPSNGPAVADGNSWDIEIDTLLDYLDGDDAVFYFNNNEENDGTEQNLFGWAQVSVIDADGLNDTLYYDFTNDSQGVDSYVSPGETGTPGSGSSDLVLSGGAVCLDASDSIVDCGDPAAVTTLNHNLGANEAAYALFSPELNGGLADWLGQGYDVLSMSIFLDELSNGYEQIFLQSSTVQPIPEPTTMLLLGTGLLGLIGFSRRFKKR